MNQGARFISVIIKGHGVIIYSEPVSLQFQSLHNLVNA